MYICRIFTDALMRRDSLQLGSPGLRLKRALGAHCRLGERCGTSDSLLSTCETLAKHGTRCRVHFWRCHMLPLALSEERCMTWHSSVQASVERMHGRSSSQLGHASITASDAQLEYERPSASAARRTLARLCCTASHPHAPLLSSTISLRAKQAYLASRAGIHGRIPARAEERNDLALYNALGSQR